MNTSEYSESGHPIYRHSSPADSSGPIARDGESIECIQKHIQTHIGGKGYVFHEIVSDWVHIDVHILQPTATRPFHTLVTAGMSDRPMTVPAGATSLRYAEMLICLPPNWPVTEQAFKNPAYYWPIYWLKLLARLPHEYSTRLGAGHTVPNGDPPAPFASNTAFCCALVASPVLFDGDFIRLDVREGKTVHFLSFIPLYREEMDFKLQHGAGALFDRLEAESVTELLDLTRKNVCPQD